MRGFTLIELLVTIVIIAILGGLAYPSFMDSIRKGRRADAIDGMTRIQQAQERWRANSPTYTTDLQLLKLTEASGSTMASPDGHYQLAVSVPAGSEGSRYTITATAQGVQAQDTTCATLEMSMVGGQLTYDSTSGQKCWPK